MATLRSIDLPDFGRDADFPALPVEEYAARLDALRERMARERLDVLAVYTDREHFANAAYLSGFDPRFEEALMLIDARGRRWLLVGNECASILPDPRLGFETVMFQDFSLLGQPRGSSKPLKRILAEFGIRAGTAVGCVGWKWFDGKLVDRDAIDLPSFIVDALRDLAGAAAVRNATHLFMDPHDGLRTTNSAAQIAQFEFAACRTSDSIRRLVEAIEPGVRESDLERLYRADGLPLSCHSMVGFGDKARAGLLSPSQRAAERGGMYTSAFGVWGSLSCRAGAVAAGPSDLAPELREFYPAYAANYFDVVVAWYEAIAIGKTAGAVYDAVEAKRDPRLLRFAVNPGHLIHLDEWLHSPFAPRSWTRLRSGMAIQMDIIPVSQGPFCCANAEDGIALADDALRDEIARRFPACWERIARRRRFMIERLGIELAECVLPLGNLAGWFPPYALDRGRAFAK